MSPFSFKFKQMYQPFTGFILSICIFILVPFKSFAQPGTLDASWGGGGIVTTDIGVGSDKGFSVIQQSDGKIVVVGLAGNGVNNDFAITRYNANGTLDPLWGT